MAAYLDLVRVSRTREISPSVHLTKHRHYSLVYICISTILLLGLTEQKFIECLLWVDLKPWMTLIRTSISTWIRRGERKELGKERRKGWMNVIKGAKKLLWWGRSLDFREWIISGRNSFLYSIKSFHIYGKRILFSQCKATWFAGMIYTDSRLFHCQ